MQPTITKSWIHPFLIALLPCVINAFPYSLLLPHFANFSLFHFQIICFQRHRMASISAVSVGNWLQKWHLAFRSDRLRAICSVFAEGDIVDVLRTDEETGNGAWNTPDRWTPIWTNEKIHLYITESIKEESSQGKLGTVRKCTSGNKRCAVFKCLFILSQGSL